MNGFLEGLNRMTPEERLYTLQNLALHLSTALQIDKLRQLLTYFHFIEAKIEALGAQLLIDDYERFFSLESPVSKEVVNTLRLLQDAIRLSAHILSQDKTQIRNQLYGRLIAQASPEIQTFLVQISQSSKKAWLRPLTPSLLSPGSPLVRTLSDPNGVTAIALTQGSQGYILISASRDYSLKVWDLLSGKLLFTLYGHSANVTALAATPDGRRAISASYDKAIKVWDLEHRRELYTLVGHTDDINAVAITPDGRHIVSVSKDRTIRIWDADQGIELMEPLLRDWGVPEMVSITPDARYVFVNSGSSAIRLWDLQNRDGPPFYIAPGDRVLAMTMTPDGRYGLTVVDDGTLRVWDPDSGLQLATLKDHDDATAISVTPDGQRVVSASEKMLKVWDLPSSKQLHKPPDGEYGRVTIKPIRTIQTLAHKPRQVLISPDGHLAISSSGDEAIKIWDLERETDLVNRIGHTDITEAIVTMPDNQRAISLAWDRKIKIWDIVRGEELISYQTDRTIKGARVTSDLRRAIFLSSDWAQKDRGVTYHGVDTILSVWDIERGNEVCTLRSGNHRPDSLEVTPDGRRAISASDETHMNSMVRVWDLELQVELFAIRCPDATNITSVTITPDGQYAIWTPKHFSSSDTYKLENYPLKILDLECGEVFTLRGHIDSINNLVVTPDSKFVLSASDDKTIKVWDLAKRKEVDTLLGHTDLVYKLIITTDGQCAISLSRDKTIKIWYLMQNTAPLTINCDSIYMRSFQMTPDSKRAVSVTDSSTIKVWDLERGIVLASFSVDDDLNTCAISPDSLHIIAGERSGQMYFLYLEGAQALKQQVRSWSSMANLGRSRSPFLGKLIGHDGPVSTVTISPDSKLAISGGLDKTIRVWDLTTGQEKYVLTGHAQGIDAIAITANNQWVVSASTDAIIKVWGLKEQNCLKTLSGHTDVIYGIAVTRDCRYVVSASYDGTVRVFDLNKGEEVHVVSGNLRPILAVALAPDKPKILATLSAPGSWYLSSEYQVLPLQGFSYQGYPGTVTLDGQWATFREEGRVLKVWNLKRGCEMPSLTYQAKHIHGIAALPYSRYALAATLEGTILVLDLENGVQLRTLVAHEDEIFCIAVTPDGQRAISASFDGTLKIWDCNKLLR